MIDSVINLLANKRDERGLGITFVSPGDIEGEFYPYSALRRDAIRYRQILQGQGFQAGDHVLLQLVDNKALVQAFWACLWGGFVPVPMSAAGDQRALGRVARVQEILPRSHVLFQRADHPDVPAAGGLPGAIDFDSLDPDAAPGPAEPDPEPVLASTVRLVQFSSGSTGDPKGVIITEGGLLAGLRACVPRRTPRLVNSLLSWLPLTHNLSLVGVHLYSICQNYGQVLMPPSQFAMDPLSWLRAIGVHRPTVTFCPNFACKHVLKALARLGPEAIAGCDLSSVHKIVNGAEPIDQATVQAFESQLEPFGLMRNVMVPGYGLTEASLGVTIAEIYQPLHTLTLDRDRIAVGQSVADIQDDGGATFTGLGAPTPGMSLSIRDAAGNILDNGVIGEIWIRGDSLSSGYIDAKGVHRHRLSPDGYLDTGDLGAVFGADLYVLGRKKDIIFVNGKNVYSHDLERVLEEALGFDCAVLGRTDDSGAEAVFVFLADADTADRADREEAAGRAVATLMREFGVPTTQVVWVGEIPRTQTGKKERFALQSLIPATV
ncbi:MAG: AMP-binding protein [Bifidobacteriaceae bacterium]|jgi:acyl-CoA synthetase (AMP-forming)/AMP-acid ligase II|nr:AMP-binding protein [Bifidobacteriaceae bacterium]